MKITLEYGISTDDFNLILSFFNKSKWDKYK
jgi:hypothetical protein